MAAASARVSIFYVTDRDAERYMPGGFGYARAATPSCGVVVAEVPAAKMPGGPDIFAKEESRRGVPCGAQGRSLVAALTAQTETSHCRALLIYVHGFDTGFETDALRAAQIGSDTQWPCAVASFSWSSSGREGNYAEDVSRLTAAEPLLRELLTTLAQAHIRTSIVAHSLGSRLVLAALASANGSKALADQVIFAAPDIGVGGGANAFAELYANAAPHLNRLTVYVSREDVALAYSRRENAGVPRLGRDTGNALPGGVSRIDFVDASDAPGDLIGHNYYDLSHEMLADMSLALASVPASARLESREGARPTLLSGADRVPYRLNVDARRRPDIVTRILRWIISLPPAL